MKILRKWLLGCTAAAVFLALAVFPAFAEEVSDVSRPKNAETADKDAQNVSEIADRVETERKLLARGMYFSSINGRLTRECSTTADVYVDVVCHENVRKILLSVTLQKKAGSGWENIDKQDFSWQGEDFDNDLSYARVSYTVTGLTGGAVYRVKATGSCTSMFGDTEARSMMSGGLTF